MARTVMVRNLVAVAAITLVSAGLSGCDYWPPALQTQIEQLHSELQTATMEKAQLQNELASLTKVKDDMQAQVSDLSRANQDKSTMIASLQTSLAAAQGRSAKSAKLAPPNAAVIKPSTKVTQKASVKKNAPVKKKTPVKKKAPAKAAAVH